MSEATDLANACHCILAGEPFVIDCIGCDVGQDVGSITEALAAGWREIHFERVGVANFLGWCEQCWAEENRTGELF